MKRVAALLLVTTCASAQTYDSSSLVDTNNTNVSTSTSTVNSSSTVQSVNTNVNTNTSTSTNTNHNIVSGEQTINNNNHMSGAVTYTNNNVQSGSVTYTNNNVSSGEVTYNNKNTSTSTTNNTSSSTSANTNVNTNVQTGDMTNRNISDTRITQEVIQPPPTAVSPTMMSGGNADLCSTGSSGAVQTQIFGVSSGGTVRDMNCERLRLSKTLYDMGMKVAAVATMCQDRRVFDGMMAAGTPCPYEGLIGEKAKQAWMDNPGKVPRMERAASDDTFKKISLGALLGVLVYALF